MGGINLWVEVGRERGMRGGGLGLEIRGGDGCLGLVGAAGGEVGGVGELGARAGRAGLGEGCI